jgi:hypothetical protein
MLVLSSVVLAIFVRVEQRAKRPMLDLSLFRYPRFIGVQFLAAAPAYSYVVLLVLLPLRFIGVQGLGAAMAGQAMFALSAPMLVVPMLAGMLTRWISAGAIAGVGLLLCACGHVWFAQCPPAALSTQMAMVLIGIGISLPWGLMDALAVSVVPKERAGMAAGIFNTTRVAGEGVALAVVTALLAQFVESNLRGANLGYGEHGPLTEVASLLAMGDVSRSIELLPHVTRAALVQSYDDAFNLLLYVLAGISVISAAAMAAFLNRQELPHTKPIAPSPASRRHQISATTR